MKVKHIPIYIFIGLVFLATLTGCPKKNESNDTTITYRQVSAEEAKEIMDEEKGYAILDARTEAEYKQGHIKNAILIPHDQVYDKARSVFKDKNQLIFVYCRSGNRSKSAASSLVKLGYRNIVEFGGINKWPYEVVK